ncbi:MAG TPA: hypothetical protein PLH21_02515 [Chiayiivirga sp.]|nr:hypothetical protein [Chiayiivirga sp.]
MASDARRFAVVPAHVVRQAPGFDDAAEAAVAAAQLVGKDRVTRIVVELYSEISTSDKPHVKMVQIAEVAR